MNASESASKRYRVRTAGVIRGPFSPGRIQQLLDDGTIGPRDGACADGEDWTTVAVVLGLSGGADTARGASPPALPPRRGGGPPPSRPSVVKRPPVAKPAGVAVVPAPPAAFGPSGPVAAGLPAVVTTPKRTPRALMAIVGLSVVLAVTFVVAVLIFRGGSAGPEDAAEVAGAATVTSGEAEEKQEPSRAPEMVPKKNRSSDDGVGTGFREWVGKRVSLAELRIKRDLSKAIPRAGVGTGPEPVWPVFLDIPGPSDRDLLRGGAVLRWPAGVGPALDFEGIREMAVVGDWSGQFARGGESLELRAGPGPAAGENAVRFVVPETGRFADRLVVVLDDDGLSDMAYAEAYSALCWQVLKITRKDGDDVFLRPWSAERPTGVVRELRVGASVMQVAVSSADLGFGLPDDWLDGAKLIPSLYRWVKADGTPIVDFERGQTARDFVAVATNGAADVDKNDKNNDVPSVHVSSVLNGDLEQVMFVWRGERDVASAGPGPAKLTAADSTALQAIADRLSRKRNHAKFFAGDGFSGSNGPQRAAFRRHSEELLWEDSLISEDLSLNAAAAAALNFDPKFRSSVKGKKDVLTREYSRQMIRLRQRIVQYLQKAGPGEKPKDAGAVDRPAKSYVTGRLYYMLEDGGVPVPLVVVEFVRPAGASTPPTPTARTANRDRDVANSVGMTFRLVRPGEFLMGSHEVEAGRSTVAREELQHPVTLTTAYYLGVHEVRQKEFQAVMGTNPSRQKVPDHPVDRVSWSMAKRFCDRLSRRVDEKAAGRRYRLPTEAEWEYACRAGTKTAFSFGHMAMPDQAAYSVLEVDVPLATRPVGSYPANPWGFYDMHGNVWEWCRDYFASYRPGAATDPTGPVTGTHHVLRGGSASVLGQHCRSAVRGEAVSDGPDASARGRFEVIGDFGLRVVMEMPRARPGSVQRKRGP